VFVTEQLQNMWAIYNCSIHVPGHGLHAVTAGSIMNVTGYLTAQGQEKTAMAVELVASWPCGLSKLVYMELFTCVHD